MQDLFLKMDKIGFVKNGVFMRLPPGFRFCPTDEELVVEYLKRKVLCVPLPASVIPEFDVCKLDPWNLPGDKGKERYFFSTKETKYLNGKWSNRAIVSGYWKATGKDKEIVSSKSKQVVGMKKTLVFYRGKPQHGSKTDWIMHQLRLVGVENSSVQNCVVCRISFKKKCYKTSYEPMQPCKQNSIATVTDLNLSSYSSGSSGITEIPNCEESSSCNSFSSFRMKP